jgi:hypothetical protein
MLKSWKSYSSERPAVGWSAWLGLSCSLMSRRRAALPALLEIYGRGTAESVANSRAELLKGIAALGVATNSIAVICCGGVATIVDAEDPMCRVIGVAHGVRPRFGKLGLSREIEKSIKQTELNEHCPSDGIIKCLAHFIGRLGQRLHRPNEKELSHRWRQRALLSPHPS